MRQAREGGEGERGSCKSTWRPTPKSTASPDNLRRSNAAGGEFLAFNGGGTAVLDVTFRWPTPLQRLARKDHPRSTAACRLWHVPQGTDFVLKSLQAEYPILFGAKNPCNGTGVLSQARSIFVYVITVRTNNELRLLIVYWKVHLNFN